MDVDGAGPVGDRGDELESRPRGRTNATARPHGERDRAPPGRRRGTASACGGRPSWRRSTTAASTTSPPGRRRRRRRRRRAATCRRTRRAGSRRCRGRTRGPCRTTCRPRRRSWRRRGSSPTGCPSRPSRRVPRSPAGCTTIGRSATVASGASQLLGEHPDGRALVAGDERGRGQPEPAVEAELVDGKPGHRLHAREEDAAVLEPEPVGEFVARGRVAADRSPNCRSSCNLLALGAPSTL